MYELNYHCGLESISLNPSSAMYYPCTLSKLLSFSESEFSHLYVQNTSWKAVRTMLLHINSHSSLNEFIWYTFGPGITLHYTYYQ